MSRKKRKKSADATHKDGGEKDAPPSPRITGRRLWLFRLVALTVIPALLFIFLELALRIVGYGYPAAAIIKYKTQGKTYHCSNYKFGWRFFPPQITREFDPFVIPAQKGESTYRIFILGGSAAQGTPDGAYGFGRFLELMLSQQYPDTNFEVFTVAMPAINSHVARVIAKGCARYEPDLFIVYMGNNEVVGPYGAGTVFAPLSKNLALIRLGIALKAARFGQLLTNIATRVAQREGVPETWGGLEMFLDKQIRPDEPQMQAVYSHFGKNLLDIAHTAQKSGAKIIFSTVGANLRDNPPFASLHRQDLAEQQKEKWEQLYQQGTDYEDANNFSEAIDRYLAAAEIDDTFADLHFRLGQCYWNLSKFEDAKQSFTKALVFDTLRFRADTKINEIIRDVAGDKTDGGICLVDAAEVFEQNSPQSTTGYELFLEHVHLNFSGNYLLAETILEQVEEILPARIKSKKAQEIALITPEECEVRLAFSGWDQYKIVNGNLSILSEKAPFINQIYHDRQIKYWQQRVDELKEHATRTGHEAAARMYEEAIRLDDSDWHIHFKYAQLLWGAFKNSYGSAQHYRRVIQLVPHNLRAHIELATFSGMHGDHDAAIAHSREAIRIMPFSATAYYNIGLAYQMRGELKKAQDAFTQAIEIQPKYSPAYTNLGRLLYNQGRRDRAEQVYRKGIEMGPENPYLHYNLGMLLRAKGQTKEAREEIQKAVEIDPNFARMAD